MTKCISKFRVWEGDYQFSAQIVTIIPANNAGVVYSSLKFSQTLLFLKLYEALFHYLMNLFFFFFGAMDF